MSYEIDKSLSGARRFRPMKDSDIKPRHMVTVGTTGAAFDSPYKGGIETLAYNQLTMWAQLTKPLVADDHWDKFTVASQDTDYDFAAYKFPVPSFINTGASSGRRYLQVSFTGFVSAGTYVIKGRTSAGSATSVSSGTTSLGTVDDLYVPLPAGGTDEEYLILTVRRTGNAASQTFYVGGIRAWVKTLDSDTLTATEIGIGDVEPIDSTVQVGADRPLSVNMVRALISSNASFRNSNVNCIANFCALGTYNTLWSGWTHAAPQAILLPAVIPALSTTAVSHFHEWVYFRRPGITHVRVCIDAYVAGWMSSSDNLPLTFGWVDADGRETMTTVDINKATYFSSATWLVSQDLLVPGDSDQSPLFLRVYTDDWNAYVGAVSIYELEGRA